MAAAGKKRKWPKIVLTVLCILLALILVGMIFGFVYVKSLLNKIPRLEESVPTLSPEQIASIESETDPVDPTFQGAELNPTDVTWATEPAPTIGKEDTIINILLIGQDREPGEGRQRSDSMILCTLNTETKTLTMTSFLRDLYVQIPGYRDNRLNASYQFGGMPLLNQSLEVNFGVHVDGNVEVDFKRFEKLINLMGGVDVSLTQKEVDYLNACNNWGFVKGSNHMNGQQALEFARIRKIDSDFNRTGRQRRVLTALINQCRYSSVSHLMDLLDEVLGLVKTDLTDEQIINYALEIFPLLSELTITTQHIPAAGTYDSVRIRGMAVLVPDLEANRQILAESLAGQ